MENHWMSEENNPWTLGTQMEELENSFRKREESQQLQERKISLILLKWKYWFYADAPFFFVFTIWFPSNFSGVTLYGVVHLLVHETGHNLGPIDSIINRRTFQFRRITPIWKYLKLALTLFFFLKLYKFMGKLPFTRFITSFLKALWSQSPLLSLLQYSRMSILWIMFPFTAT